MKKLFVLFSLFFFEKAIAQTPAQAKGKFVLVIHGGAGTILKSQMTPEKEKAYTDALNQALEKGSAILSKGGSALDAVEASVRVLEDNPLFNAGKGAVFTNEGKNELDAAIMNGKTLEAGSVAGVTTIKNPISAARAVMEKSPHVMMVGKGAEQFAKQQGLEIVDPSYFHTESRWKGLQKAKQEDSVQRTNKDTIKKTHAFSEFFYSPLGVGGKYGTVGAVALDQHGNLAAATSTGGMTNKKFGRIGDSPIIGAGTYANNKTVAISGTGWGEFFIRLVMAKSISDMMEFGKIKLKAAADEMILKRLPALGGDGGLIAVDKDGNIAMPFCTEGMYRGYLKQGGRKVVEIYKK
ncbi:isoaspartyl peptidase/L-asparaginase family protein [Terrimonas alba]|uniref:isoaspartyl peptidase/L-asparaginase family protein n=1 Tax=Terrimonas alba TaxID=3349636 RepID=UPI0035F4510E